MRKIYLSVLLVASLSSCEKFLDKKPQNFMVAEGYYETEQDAVSALMGIYNDYQDARFVIHNFLLITSIGAGDCWEPNSNAPQFNEYEKLEVTAGNVVNRQLFFKAFGTIGKTVRLLKYLPNLNVDADKRLELEAETKFMRALSYYHLVGIFGGLPLLKEAPVYGESNEFLRSSTAETWNFIIEDLTFAAQHLPKSQNTSNLGRATRGSANGILARVLALRAQDDFTMWTKAKEAAQSVIDDGYRLDESYANNFLATGNYNAESLFEIAFDPVSSDGQGNMISLYQTAAFAGGWSYGEAFSNAYNNFESGDLIRRRAAVYKVGDSINFKSEIWDGDNDPEYLVPSPSGYVRAGTAKYNNPVFEPAGSGTNTNYKLLRFAEILLIMAEAENELGNTSSALSFVKMVRDRVNLETNLSISDQSEVRELIFKERMAELCMEGVKFYDLVQRGRARDFSQTSFDRDEFVFPIPEEEIQKNGWVQNSSMTQTMKNDFIKNVIVDIR